MTSLPCLECITACNEKSLQELVWAIEMSKGEFTALLAHCNDCSLRNCIRQRLQTQFTFDIQEIFLTESDMMLYTTIKKCLRNEQVSALMVLGLESVVDIDRVLIMANLVREEFRNNFQFPIVFWVNDRVITSLIRIAPDFHSWTTTTLFAIKTEELIQASVLRS